MHETELQCLVLSPVTGESSPPLGPRDRPGDYPRAHWATPADDYDDDEAWGGNGHVGRGAGQSWGL